MRKFSEETRLKMSIARKGMIPWNKGLKGFRAGVRHSEETKKKISDSHLGMKHSDSTKAKLRLFFSGKPIKEETRLKIQATMKAKFISNPEVLERKKKLVELRGTTEYLKWRIAVLERDGSKCLWCGESDKSKLTVDHIRPLCKNMENATELSNGRTLCNLCHLKTTTHGRGSWLK